MRVAIVNGAPGAALSPWDRGLLYGDGVFETMPARRGEPVALGEHLALLSEAARALGFALDTPTLAALDREAREAVRLAGQGDQIVRVLVTRGEGAGAVRAAQTPPTRVILVEPWAPLPDTLYSKGIDVDLVQVPSPGWPWGLKTTAYGAHLALLEQGRARGLGEVLVKDEAGFLLQGSTSNVLLVRGGALVTPALSAEFPWRVRPGVTRGRVLRLASSAGLRVEERGVGGEEVFSCEEMFVCASLRGLVPVVRVGGRDVGAGRPGEVFLRLSEALAAG